jgi:Zn-dependent protease
MKNISFRLLGLELIITPSAWLGDVLLFMLLYVIGINLIGLSQAEAIIGALIGVILHFVSVFLHHYGHALAARSTGYPMTGIRLWAFLGTSLYPKGEPELPAKTHIRRASGGPAMNLIVGGIAVALLLALGETRGVAWWLVAFFAFDNLIVFGLGSLLPLGFTDGSTLLRYWGKQ